MNDATALAASIAAGEISATACMQASLRAAKDLAHLGALTRAEPELGLERAHQADKAQADGLPEDLRGPFHGAPFLGKDLGGCGQGLAPSAGNAALRAMSSDPEASDHLFRAFEANGLISFGLTTVPEFGLSLTSEPPGGPVARNPFDPALSPGGSSGGAAAAVASGIVGMAHATDAAGSIRVPAACTGLVGLKPSRERVTGAPHYTNDLMGIASQQVLTRSVRDARTLFDTVKRDHQQTIAPTRLGLSIPKAASTDTITKMEALAATLIYGMSDAGIEVVPVPALDAVGERASALTIPIFAASLASWLDGVGIGDDQITPICAAVAQRGRAMAAQELFNASVEMKRLTHEVYTMFQRVDAFITPVLADGPPKIGHFDPSQSDVEARLDQMNRLAPNVALANVTGYPALAMPFGMMPAPREHIPFGFQIMGQMGSDEALFDLAARIEALTPPIAFPHPIAGLA